jgi:hypothetical protein
MTSPPPKPPNEGRGFSQINKGLIKIKAKSYFEALLFLAAP